MAKVQRLKPAHKIYERLIWDQDCISGANFVIGYEDRFLGIMEATREEFESEEIPFHRIRYFKDVETGQHIWDREKRIDLITRNYANTFTLENDSSSLSKKPSLNSLEHSNIHSSSSYSVNKYSDSNQNSKELSYNNKNSWEQQSRTIPVFSTKSKKNYLKRRRKKHRLRELSEARQRTEEEERIEAEHDQMYEDKMREVEERILRFQQFQIVRI
ncbi:hypothetical protein RclHR1_00310052 [Rhizophagus clarus]|uniref:MJ1316 RNA cyclic group end recognition domain-containing protein n=1 Tax=Rhizophagus clarus TaxID=94130 RepID=A0A2Z6RIN3_9GLOM|nr:hypothetical protein RclHR1_00310052 [Rhizophagus clarus]